MMKKEIQGYTDSPWRLGAIAGAIGKSDFNLT
jgi:hypothetical protein